MVLQLGADKGNIRANLAKLETRLLELAPLAPEVVVLPEAFLTGYFLQGGVRELAMTASELYEALSALHPRVQHEPLDLVIGFYERDGSAYYNAAAYLELGGHGLVHIHRKIFLPTYGVFDEERFLSRGRKVAAFDTRFGRAAMLICEDFWHSITATIAALDGAEILYVPSASPARDLHGTAPGNVLHWKALAQAVAAEHGLYVALASLVGSEGGKILSGGSVVAGPEGELLAEAPPFEEIGLLADLALERIPPVRYDNPLLADLKTGLPLVFPDLERILERE